MLDNAIIMSIQPKYYDLISSGKKTVEIRKQLPKKLERGDLVLLYVTSPVKALAGAFVVEEIKKLPLDKLWAAVKNRLGMPRREFDMYYEGISYGVAIFFTQLWQLSKPFDLVELREDLEVFIPPQSFRYVTNTERRYLVRTTNTGARRRVKEYGS